MTLHIDLKVAIDRHFADRLAADTQLAQDAIVVRLNNGVTLELRYAGPDEYAFNWQWGDARLRIDTAPLHEELATFPNHLHDADDAVRADPITRTDRDAWDNTRRLLEALSADPLLQSA